MAFLERDIKTRKQAFGIEIYDILASNSGDATASATKIQEAYDQCQKDIRQLESKVNSKKGEMESIERSSAGGVGAGGGGSGGGIDDAETPGIPSTP